MSCLAVLVGLVLLLPVQVCRDWGFIDHNTGSRKGYREWFFGWRSGSWYRESPIEKFMRSKYPAEFRQDWVSFAGTGRNVLGRPLPYGHGRPGPVVLLKPELLEDYCRDLPEAEMRRLYDLLSDGNSAELEALVARINE